MAQRTRGSFAAMTAIANTRVNFAVAQCWTLITGTQAIVDFISISHALVVADQSSFSRAARILGVKQSAVSRRIQALEDELGVSLFERQSNGVRLTIAGQRFLERTRSAFAEIDYAIKNAAAAGRGDEGVIRIGVLPSLLSGFLCDVLAEFREAQPGVILDFFDGPPKKLIERIMARQLDMAFVVSGTPTPGCDAEALWSAGICVALPDRHPLAGCDAIDWELLRDERFVFGRDGSAAGLDDHAIERVAGIGGRLSSSTHDVSQDLVMQFVALGFGLSLVSDLSTTIPYPGVAFRPLAGEDHHVSYSAVWLPGNDNPALRRFLSLARSKSAERWETPAPQASD
jgi:DNA-binding transcriptional LysR family regulator